MLLCRRGTARAPKSGGKGGLQARGGRHPLSGGEASTDREHIRIVCAKRARNPTIVTTRLAELAALSVQEEQDEAKMNRLKERAGRHVKEGGEMCPLVT
jgi:hypothetical protein